MRYVEERTTTLSTILLYSGGRRPVSRPVRSDTQTLKTPETARPDSFLPDYDLVLQHDLHKTPSLPELCYYALKC